MSDLIISAIAGNDSVIGYFATTKELVNKAFEIHQTYPVASAALGRMLTASAIMGRMLKNEDDLVTLVIKGDGPLQGIVATADEKSRVKGFIYNPNVDIPLNAKGKLDVSSAIGSGTLNVIKDSGMNEPYAGKIDLVSGEIAEDLTHYFLKSEQVASSVALGVLVDRDLTIKQAGGFIVQLLPNCKEDVVNKLEENIKSLKNVTTLLDEGKSLEDIICMVFSGMTHKILDTTEPTYYCNCSRDRIEKALISLGKEELEKILEEDGKATLHCHFCRKDYDFSFEQLGSIIKKL